MNPLERLIESLKKKDNSKNTSISEDIKKLQNNPVTAHAPVNTIKSTSNFSLNTFLDSLKNNTEKAASSIKDSIYPQKILSPVPNYTENQPTQTVDYKLNNVVRNVLQPLAAAQRYIESPTPTKIVPELKAPVFHTSVLNPISKAATFGANVAGSVVNNVVGKGVIDPSLDIGRMVGKTITGQANPEYSSLKSAPARLGYNIMGYNRTPSQVIGNVAGTIEPAVTAYSGGKVFGIGESAVANVGEETLKNILLDSAKQGFKYGFTQGTVSGLSENRDDPVLKQVGKSLLQGAQTGVTGAIFSSIIAGTGYAGGKIFDRLKDAYIRQSPDATEEEAAKNVKIFLRDEAGRFTGVTKRDTFIKDSQISDAQRMALRESLGLPIDGNYQSGAIDFNAEVGGNNSTIPKQGSFEQLLESNTGWKPGMRKQFDTALFRKDKATIEQLLPEVPDDYKARFAGKIEEITGKKVSDIVSQINTVPQQTSPLSEGLNTSSSGSSNNITSKVENPQDPYFNVNRLNVNNDVKQSIKKVIEETKPQIEEVVGKKLSNKEAVDVANNSAQTIRKVISRDETLAWEAKMVRARQLLADQANEGTVTKEYIDNLIAIKSQGTDIARKLQSLSIGADPKAITAKQAILEAVLKATDNADEVIKAADGVNFNDLKQSTEFYRKFIKPTSEDWMTLLRYNSMLSSPNTHIVNTSSNFQGTGIIAPIEKTILGGVDFLKSKITGSDRQYYAGEGIEYAKGYYSNMGEAAHSFADVMRGKDLIANPDVRDIPLTTDGISHKVENVLSFPLKMLEGADRFFQTLTEGGVKKSLEYRASKGIDVKNMDLQASEEAAKRLFRSDINLKEQGVLLNSIDDVTKIVFNLRSSDNPIVRTIAKFTLPFVKTPMNILKQGVEYSPTGFGTMIGASNKTEQFTKALLGTSIGIGSAMLLGSDRLTWAEPTSATQRDNFRAAGLQPYSVKIGDNWVSYSKLHPAISFNLALVSAVYDAQKNKKLSDSEAQTVLSGLAKWWGFFADQSYVKNIGDFVASSKGDLEGAARYISNYPQQLIPFRALMGWVTRIVDPIQRKVDPKGTILEKQLLQIATQIPGLSSKVPARVDAKGMPIEQPHPFINAFSPNKITTEDPNAKQYYDSKIKDSTYNKKVQEVRDYKNEAIDLYLKGSKVDARNMREKYGFTVTQSDIKSRTNIYKEKAIDAFLDGDKDIAKSIREEWGNFPVTQDDIKKQAKKRAIKLFKEGKMLGDESLKQQARELRSKYGFTVKLSDLE